MNTKRNLQLIASIFGILASAITIMNEIIYLVKQVYYYYDGEVIYYLDIVLSSINFAFALALLIMCCMMCKTPQDKKPLPYMGATIACIVCSVIMFAYVNLSILTGMLYFVVFILLMIAVCKKVIILEPKAPIVITNHQRDNIDVRVEKITRLYKLGYLTEEGRKNLILKIIREEMNK